MVRMHVWLRRKEGMSPEQFRDYWVNTHAPIARDGYGHLVVPATRGHPLSVLEGEGVVVLLGARGEALSFLLVSERTQTPSEAWGDGLDGPVE